MSDRDEQRISPRFWDFTWSGTDIADALQEQVRYGSVMEEVIRVVHTDRRQYLLENPQQLLNYVAQTGAAYAWDAMSDPSARVVMVTPEQFRSLPVGTHDELIEVATECRPPFAITYFDLAGPGKLGIPIELQNPDATFGGTGAQWVSHLTGVLFLDFPDGLVVMPILRERATLRYGLHVLVPGRISYLRTPDSTPIMQSLADVIVIDGWVESFPDLAEEPDSALRGHLNVGRMLADRCLPLLQLLESVNVDLEDAPLRPKQEKVAQRKARVRPLVVTVQRKVRKARPVSATEPTRHLTVQFEVRGHFKHHGPGTPIFRAAERCQPEKIKDRPGRGPCVRLWCPPFLKGPIDAPLILKARRISGDDARRGREEDAA